MSTQKVAITLALNLALQSLKTEGRVDDLQLRLGQVFVSIDSIEVHRDEKDRRLEVSVDINGLTSRKWPDELTPVIKAAGDFAGKIVLNGVCVRGHNRQDLELTIKTLEFSSAIEALEFGLELGTNVEVI